MKNHRMNGLFAGLVTAGMCGLLGAGCEKEVVGQETSQEAEAMQSLGHVRQVDVMEKGGSVVRLEVRSNDKGLVERFDGRDLGLEVNGDVNAVAEGQGSSEGAVSVPAMERRKVLWIQLVGVVTDAEVNGLRVELSESFRKMVDEEGVILHFGLGEGQGVAATERVAGMVSFTPGRKLTLNAGNTLLPSTIVSVYKRQTGGVDEVMGAWGFRGTFVRTICSGVYKISGFYHYSGPLVGFSVSSVC